MKIENLTTREREEMLRFLLHHLEPELRGKLMVAMPVVYVKAAPHTAETVLERVTDEMRRVQDLVDWGCSEYEATLRARNELRV